MNKRIGSYPAYFQALKPTSICVLGTQASKDLWSDVYLQIDQTLFYVSVTPLLDDRDFDYVFCLELIAVERFSEKSSPREICRLNFKPVIQPKYFALSERLSGDQNKSIKRLNMVDAMNYITVEPSYDEYFSCRISYNKKSDHLKPVT